MKKILLLIIFLTTFCLYNDVSALEEQIYEGEKIENMWIKKVKGEKVEYHQAAFIRRKSDNNYIYCIEPWSVIKENENYNDIINANNLDDDTIRKITTAAYYGYGTINHTTKEWYYITQVAIWKIIDPTADFYFTDKLNGNKITTYDNKITEILNLVELNNKVPHFNQSEITIPLGSLINLTDQNNILNEFYINKEGNSVTPLPMGNILKLAANKIGTTTLTFTKERNRFNSSPLIYRHPKNQNFLSAGNIPTLLTELKVNVVDAKITVNKLDQTTNSTTASGEATLESTFRLYNAKNELIDEKTTINSQAIFTNLTIGKYYLEEIKAGNGYELNNEKKEINLTSENYDVYIDFYNKVITNVVTLQKLYGKNEIWKHEENAQFNIYNNKNELVKSVKTDNNGIITLTLPYGTYKFTQVSGKENYELSKPFIIKIEEPNKNIHITKYNNEILGNINILKIDNKTNRPVKNNYAIFKIFDYSKNDWLTNTYRTNEDGFLSIKNLSLGKYKIIEIKSPDGYKISENEYIIELTKDNKEIYLEIENEKVYKVPNTGIIIEPIKLEKITYEYKKKYFITYYNILTN